MAQSKDLAVIAGEVTKYTPQQLELIKTTVAKGTTNDQLSLFLYTAKHTGLDPLLKQIHAVVRSGKNGKEMAIQSGIDGLRLIADRTGKYAGNDDPIFVYPSGKSDGEPGEFPTKATVTVYKMMDGQKVAFTASARWSEYKPPADFMWKKMPHVMLGKCAEALALRKAFPAEMGSVLSNEEMAQATEEQPAKKSTKPQVEQPKAAIDVKVEPDKSSVKSPMGKVELKKCYDKCEVVGISLDTFWGYIKKNYSGVKNFAEIDASELPKIMKWISEQSDGKEY